ncbi:TetR/AcrR family transcriptional regulator [Actinomadura rupiterrae]|uniref:TetR/AcrR family transcriptional regulator n=1 Tax=Actinomadura rupiterrae TaxID=559627 RepID=UPI0020A2A337|nr:TetR/AcrR family transcriptional regulator [Actinomadura rupiterrae]MCP2340690.1 AcrR family transcriptional regulator [Actinomadura rupiterrae]
MNNRGQATRARLVDISSRLFAEYGYEGTSIEAVLHRANVSRGALYHHFDNKEALFEAVLEELETDITRQVLEAGKDKSPVDALRAGCRAWIRLAAEPTVRRIVLIDAPAVLGWQQWREIEERHALGLFKSVLDTLAEQGALPAERADLWAHMLLASINELALLVANSEGSPESVTQAEAAADDLLGRLLDS